MSAEEGAAPAMAPEVSDCAPSNWMFSPRGCAQLQCAIRVHFVSAEGGGGQDGAERERGGQRMRLSVRRLRCKTHR